MNHWQTSASARDSAWACLHGPLAEETGWDIALLQECGPPAPGTPAVWSSVRGLDWGTAVVARDGTVRRIELEDDSPPGCIVAADVTVARGGRTTAVALYGLPATRKSVDGQTHHLRYAVTTVHRMLSDLTPLIDHHGRRRGRRW